MQKMMFPLPEINFEEKIKEFREEKLDFLNKQIKKFISPQNPSFTKIQKKKRHFRASQGFKGGMPKKTLYITRYLKDYFENYDCVVQLEVKTNARLSYIIEKYNKVINRRLSTKNVSGFGYIDMRVISKNQVLDIEIDSRNNPRSICKLLYCREELGSNILWIRHTTMFKNFMNTSLYQKINIIEVI